MSFLGPKHMFSFEKCCLKKWALFRRRPHPKDTSVGWQKGDEPSSVWGVWFKQYLFHIIQTDTIMIQQHYINRIEKEVKDLIYVDFFPVWGVWRGRSPPNRQENFGLVRGLKWSHVDHKVTCNRRWKAFDSISIHWEVAALWNKFWWKKSRQNSDFWQFWDVPSLPW
jgi:hypothetical protein